MKEVLTSLGGTPLGNGESEICLGVGRLSTFWGASSLVFAGSVLVLDDGGESLWGNLPWAMRVLGLLWVWGV